MITFLIVLGSLAAYLGIGRVAATYQISNHGKELPYYSMALKYAEDPNRFDHYDHYAVKYQTNLRNNFITMNLLWIFWLPCRAIYNIGNFFISGGTHSIDGVIAKHSPVTKQVKVNELETRAKEQAKTIARLEREAEKNRVPDVLDELENYPLKKKCWRGDDCDIEGPCLHMSPVSDCY